MHRLLLMTALMLPLPALAQDAALVLGMERYEQLDRVNRADNILGAVERLEALGFVVFSRANARVDAANDLSAAFQSGVADADRLVVAVSGHFVTDGARTWLLTADSAIPDLFTVGDASVSIDSVLRVLANRQGRAVLLLGAADGDDLDMRGLGLSAGIGALDIPQGVTVIRTSPTIAARVLSGVLTEPNAVIGADLAANTSVSVTGYLPSDWTLMPGEVIIETPTPVVGPSAADLNAEAALWDSATAADSVAGYRNYVARYPQGRFVGEAETQIAAILAEPDRTARLSEDALNLNRAARRRVQTQLSALSYNTRGVDGIFGPGTRGAITNWQQTNGFPQTSYLTSDQINLLDAQAARREAEIDAQEARDRAQAEALDRNYWSETGAIGGEPGFRAYLGRYPDGLFSDIAKARLSEIDGSRRDTVRAADRAAWATAQGKNSIAGYQDYVAAYPSGEFENQARRRIERIETPDKSIAQVTQAEREEARLRLSGLRAQLLELRLRDLGHNPGTLDGVIDRDTRRAIAAYQQAQGLARTGYVDRETALGLLTGAIGSIGR